MSPDLSKDVYISETEIEDQENVKAIHFLENFGHNQFSLNETFLKVSAKCYSKTI